VLQEGKNTEEIAAKKVSLLRDEYIQKFEDELMKPVWHVV